MATKCTFGYHETAVEALRTKRVVFPGATILRHATHDADAAAVLSRLAETRRRGPT